MIDCKIVGVNQGMDFETNTATMSVVLELPDGRRVQLAADEDVLQKVIELQVGAHGVPVPSRKPFPETAPMAPEPVVRANEPRFEPLSIDKEGMQEFGGNYVADDVDYSAPQVPAAPETATAVPEEEEDEEEEEPPPAKTETATQAKKRIRRNGSTPSRSVPKNELGYPIVAGGPDPDQLTTSFGQDEDGVGSV